MTVTDKYGRPCRPWNDIHVERSKCDQCEFRTRFCLKRADKMRGWWV